MENFHPSSLKIAPPMWTKSQVPLRKQAKGEVRRSGSKGAGEGTPKLCMEKRTFGFKILCSSYKYKAFQGKKASSGNILQLFLSVKTVSPYVAQASLKRLILLPQPPECSYDFPKSKM